ARKQLIDDVFQITGISDIVRGDTDPRETKGAQELKGQYASVRIRDRINEMARFGQQAARLTAEIISEQFQPQTLMEMTNIKLPTQAEIDQQVLQQQIAALRAQAQQQAMQQQPAPAGAM
ncbi:hypothetical protein ACFQZO_37045, partial [Bradyrhizobium sp. GCM10027634]|nr:hypothetical protein [Bradyrhizobium sp. WYCCWR 12677]